MKILSTAFICGALLFVADVAIQAQTSTVPSGAAATSAAPAAVTPKDIGPLEAWPDKPLGKYDIVINIPEGAMPVEITVNESATGLSATFYKLGDNDAHVLTAAVNGTDLVLKGTTPHGPLTIQIRHHGTKLSGIWQLGDGRGTLEGSTKS